MQFMKHSLQRFLSVVLLMGAASLHASATTTSSVSPYINLRSEAARLPRQVVGVRDIERELACSDKCWPGYIGSTFAFSRSFRNPETTHCLFGNALLNNGCCQALRVTGSGVAGRNCNSDLLADYFGLPTDFVSTLNFNPRIINTIGDYQMYLRLDRWASGLWFYVHAPVVHTKWNLNMCEDIANIGTANYAEGYFAPTTVLRSNLLTSAGQFFAGAAPTIAGQTFNGLNYARISSNPCSSHTKTGLADLQFWLGYDVLNCDDYHFAIGLVVAAPTGTRAEARYLFEPMIGNGHAWEVGGLIRGDYLFWQNCDQTHSVRGFTQLNITHLFEARQRRTFDLKGKPLSRYALAEKLGANNTFPFLGGSTTQVTGCQTTVPGFAYSNAQFANAYSPVANLTTFCVDVSVNYQLDWVAMLTWSHCNITWDIGYNLWSRGCEKISTKCCGGDLITPNTWALKGDARVYGFLDCNTTPFVGGTAVALGATESGATAFCGTNNGSSTNAGIDNAQFAYVANLASGATAFSSISNDAEGIFAETRTSIQPVFLSSSDIDICGAQTKGLTNGFFTHVSYWWDCECWEPYIGLGGEAEFASGSRIRCAGNSCNTGSCDSSDACSTTSARCSTSSNCSSNNNCNKCAVSQWSVWIKGGFVFG
jgi:hypothetical protein